MTFFTFDDDDLATDLKEILSASAILEITEFHLFELAYRRWFGRGASEKEIEHYFVAYMFRSVVPPWVRDYCREVLARNRWGELRPEEFGVFPRPESDSMFALGVRYTALIVFLIVALHLTAILVTGY